MAQGSKRDEASLNMAVLVLAVVAAFDQTLWHGVGLVFDWAAARDQAPPAWAVLVLAQQLLKTKLLHNSVGRSIVAFEDQAPLDLHGVVLVLAQ